MNKFLWLAVFGFCLLFAGSASANINADINQFCSDGTEVNQFCNGAPLIVWWSGGSNAPSGTYCLELYHAGELVNATDITFGTACTVSDGNGTSGTFYPSDTGIILFADPDEVGTYRISVCEGACGSEGCDKDQKNVGGDSFKLTGVSCPE